MATADGQSTLRLYDMMFYHLGVGLFSSFTSMYISLIQRLLLLFLIAPAMAVAQVRFVAQAPATGNGEVRVQFILTGAQGDDFAPPSFADFTVLVGPSVSTFSGASSVNGSPVSVSTSTTYTYILSPNRKGKLQIGAASIRVGGKTMRTQPLTVSVSETASSGRSSAAREQAPSDPFEQVQRVGTKVTERDLYFTVRPSKNRVYEQEPILLTYEIHARAGVGLSNVTLPQKPDLKGFWTQEIQLPRNLQPRTERKNGGLYRVATNLQYLIFPQQSGTLPIPSVAFDCDIAQRREVIDEIDAFFNGMEDSYVKVSRRTTPTNIVVLPLPLPKPANFSGGVGQMRIKHQLLTAQPKTNDVATLRITIEGKGNLRLMKAPRVSFPKDFESFDPKMHDETKISAEGIAGAVHFDYTFVPRSVGKFAVSSVEVVYFDTQRERYETLRTPLLHLNVEKGTRSNAELDSELALRNADIRNIHRNAPEVFQAEGSSWPGTWSFWGRMLLLFAAVWGIVRYLPRGIDRWLDRHEDTSKRAGRQAHRRLRHAQRLLRVSGSDFYDALSLAMMQYLADALGAQSVLTRQHIEQLLAQRGVNEGDIATLNSLMDDIDFARFAPSSDDAAREDLLARANVLLSQLQSQLQ